MFDVIPTFEQAEAWARSKAQEVENEKRQVEQTLSEHEMWLDYGPPTKDRASEIKSLRKRIPRLGKAVKNWLKLAAIWASSKKARLKVSFSGGRSSALMARLIKKYLSHLFELVFVFANTGREDDRTLVFVDQCDREFGLNLVMVEAMIDSEAGNGTRHRIVTFATASRLSHGDWNPNGWATPFLEMVKKYGIPNLYFKPCNRELKVATMSSYMESIGWDDYFTAVGKRADEKARLDRGYMAEQVIHFLADLWRVDKQDVLSDWEDQPFDLQIEEEEGNCVDCQEKLDNKLFIVYAKRPELFDFSLRLDREFSWHGAPHYGVPTEGGRERRRWRGDRTTEQLIAQAREAGVRPHIPIREMRSHAARQFGLDFESEGCAGSCEAYPMEDAA